MSNPRKEVTEAFAQPFAGQRAGAAVIKKLLGADEVALLSGDVNAKDRDLVEIIVRIGYRLHRHDAPPSPGQSE